MDRLMEIIKEEGIQGSSLLKFLQQYYIVLGEKVINDSMAEEKLIDDAAAFKLRGVANLIIAVNDIFEL
jgi:hypothetical protein